MKLRLLSLLAGLMCLAACDNDDDSVTPNAAVVKAFSEKYPEATRIEWENENSYAKVEFIHEQLSLTAWFSQSGQWHMTKTEYRSLDRLPEAVRKAFSESEYANWIVDDIDRLERLDGETLYIIEVKNAGQEYDLYYSADGILIKAVPDQDYNDYENYLPDLTAVPAAITDFIKEKYPAARLIEAEIEHGRWEVDIIHENRAKEVVFDVNNSWVNTHYDVYKNEVEENILQALASSSYGSYRIDDIEKYETPAGEYYLFELESGKQEVDIKIGLDGEITFLP